MKIVGKDARLMKKLLRICKRREKRNPDEELVFLCLPKNDPVRREAALKAGLEWRLR